MRIGTGVNTWYRTDVWRSRLDIAHLSDAHNRARIPSWMGITSSSRTPGRIHKVNAAGRSILSYIS